MWRIKMVEEKCSKRKAPFQSGRASTLPDGARKHSREKLLERLIEDLTRFEEFGKPTRMTKLAGSSSALPVFTNEFWTSKQRAASSLHEIPYRACFKPQLPNFLISRLSEVGEVVYDPFMGRGTTHLEAAFLGRRPFGCDANPLSRDLIKPRLNPPTQNQVEDYLNKLDLGNFNGQLPENFEVFYHPKTLRELCALREFLGKFAKSGQSDHLVDWIRMVATTRLSGHSTGFFSVYTLPPNQAVSIEGQIRINQRRNQSPPLRCLKKLIMKKSTSLLRKIDERELQNLRQFGRKAKLLTSSADDTPGIPNQSVALVVTSPPFLDLVDYRKDNWLRNWFNEIPEESLPIWQFKNEAAWSSAMNRVFQELQRVLIPGGLIAFEVGDLRSGNFLMEQLVIPTAQEVGLLPKLVMVNEQEFTKTSHCWGVTNSKKGTQTNRIVVLQKPI